MNRRFIPFHFDLSPRSYLGDVDATNWVNENLPEFSGRSVSTPPVVFVTPDGKIVGRVSNYAPADTMIAEMIKVLDANPQYNQLSEAELKMNDIEKARMLLDLQKHEEATETISNHPSDAAKYLLGHIYRLRSDWEVAEKFLATVKDENLQDDVRIERAHRYRDANDFVNLQKALEDFPVQSNRYTEARYFEGLALYHQNQTSEAKKIWRDLIKSSEEDRWVYRADWAHSQAGKAKQQTSFSSDGRGSTPLGRIGYMGASHPDLKSRK